MHEGGLNFRIEIKTYLGQHAHTVSLASLRDCGSISHADVYPDGQIAGEMIVPGF